MVFVCYVLLKEANIQINFICFNLNFDHPHITVVPFVPRRQSKKPRFSPQNIVFIAKVFDMYLLLGLSSRFSQTAGLFEKIVTFAVLLKIG